MVGHRRLSSGLASCELLGVGLLSNLDLDSLALIISEGEAGRDDGQETLVLGGGFQVLKVDVVGEPIDPGRLAHASLSQNQNVDFLRLQCRLLLLCFSRNLNEIFKINTFQLLVI